MTKKYMLKKLIATLRKDYFLLAATVLFLVGAYLRFYRFDAFITFLGDQGRDASIIRKILIFEHFPAIGAPTSVGQVYLGPFYYYFITPWLLLFNFNPIGLGLAVGVFSSLYILINYFVVKDLLNKKIALISTFFVAFSFYMIEFSRFSWNPNLLPLFTLLTVYFFIKALTKKEKLFFILAGAFLSFTIQLHYLALFLIPPAALYVLITIIENRKEIKKILTGLVFSLVSFLFFSLPLLVFDLRHNFLNTKNFMTLFKGGASIAQNRLESVLNSFSSLNEYVFATEINQATSSVILLAFILSFILILKNKDNARIILLFFILSFFGVSLYGGPKYPHYFGSIYPLYFVALAYFLSYLNIRIIGSLLIVIFMAGFSLSNMQRYYYFGDKGSYQIKTAQNIARVIYESAPEDKYRLTALPERYSEATYRYFLEKWGKGPIEKDSLERTNTLFVVCERPCSIIIGNPQWDIAYFAPRKITKEWSVEGVKIYKLE